MFDFPDADNVTVFDVETTTFQKGNPFSKRNRLCAVGVLDAGGYSGYDIEYSNRPYGQALEEIKTRIERSTLLVGFNIKFDLHWIRRYVTDIVFPLVWDCQLAEFILSGQSTPYPSLNDTAKAYGLGEKIDVVKLDYWDKGIDTPDVPADVLFPYMEHDVDLTGGTMLKQLERFRNHDRSLYNTFVMQCKDILVLQEAEFQGMRLDVGLANERARACEEQLEAIRRELLQFSKCEEINWNSPDHLSAFLYGGRISIRCRVPTERVLKSGEVKIGEKWGDKDIEFKGLVKPLDRSEHIATRGMSDQELDRVNRERIEAGRKPLQRAYKTDEPTLRALKANKHTRSFLDLLIKYSEIEKLYGTYYKGLPKKIEEMDWPDSELHGQFNLCVVPTGRLSSSNPNLQNLAGETKELYVSRY